MSSTEFWDDMFAQGQNDAYSRIEMPDLKSPILQAALSHFGNLENKSIIDLGCGSGSNSLFFASQGANVISVDLSKVAIDNLSNYCTEKTLITLSV
jgi:2-polyprenyl-3-methyl-5-hydroxy-6-metoxy-1,4-benzoquinol methylase